jgi:hypothetical protein
MTKEMFNGELSSKNSYYYRNLVSEGSTNLSGEKSRIL